jgi:hypothetical protein
MARAVEQMRALLRGQEDSRFAASEQQTIFSRPDA